MNKSIILGLSLIISITNITLSFIITNNSSESLNLKLQYNYPQDQPNLANQNPIKELKLPSKVSTEIDVNYLMEMSLK